MKLFLSIALLSSITFSSFAKNEDTVKVGPGTLELQHLQKGKLDYLQFIRKTKDGPASRLALITFNVETKPFNNKPAIQVTQQWEYDTVVHKCFTVFDPKNFSNIFHETYWKRLGYSIKLDFGKKSVDFKNINNKSEVPDSVKAVAVKDFKDSFNKFNLNWHADMLIYSLLPYKEGRTFIINYYDPGFGPSEEVAYTVTSSEPLTGSNGENIDCWVLNNYVDNKAPEKGYERFWISKKTREVLKLENFMGAGRGYRYKVKIATVVD
jgi:hypothetical protein